MARVLPSALPVGRGGLRISSGDGGRGSGLLSHDGCGGKECGACKEAGADHHSRAVVPEYHACGGRRLHRLGGQSGGQAAFLCGGEEDGGVYVSGECGGGDFRETGSGDRSARAA